MIDDRVNLGRTWPLKRWGFTGMDLRAGAMSALGWWLEAGVDTMIDESPRDWLRAAAPAARADPAPAEPAAHSAPGAAAPTDTLPATIAAMHARLLDPALIPGAPGAALPPAGNTASGLMVLADMPEAEDAAVGQLISGDAGRLLDRMLGAIGRDRASIYLATVAPARLAGGRVPPLLAAELGRLALHHVALARPRMLLLLGDGPCRALLGIGLADARGKLHDLKHQGGSVAAVATFPPRYLLREQGAKAKAWQDLRLLLGGLDR
ncbi:MAG: uracil-DNA glycosylase superfamily protein [Sphingomonas bacterium]|nr:uracil-DNA glycosylase superfamily protein [Sphingomonas bacterium]